MYAQDMQNQRYVQATNVPGLNTVLTCLVDYKGFRIVAQSMIPGVLQMVSPLWCMWHLCLYWTLIVALLRARTLLA